MKETDKLNVFNKLILFSLVPISQLTLYFSVSEKYTHKELLNLKQSLNLTANQLTIFQAITVLLFSILLFGLMYLVGNALLFFSSQKDSEALFLALIAALGFSNILMLIVQILFNLYYPLLATISQTLILPLSYYYLSKQDLKGSILPLLSMIITNSLTILF